MESKITIVRDNNGKVSGTKRQNPPAKPVIKKPLTNTEIVSNNDNFDIIGVSCSFISFKDLDKNLLMTNDDLINNSILINNNFHNLILDTENFNKFNLFLSSYI